MVTLYTRAAVEIQMVMQGGKLGIVDKAVGAALSHGQAEDPQTVADIRAQKILIGGLSTTFPSLRIVGEEGDIHIEDVYRVKVDDTIISPTLFQGLQEKQLVTQDITVWIDPLDGTKEFISGDLESVTVLLGISYQGKALAGVIGQPFGRRPTTPVWGMIGAGVHHGPSEEERATCVQQRKQDGKYPQIVTTKSHFTPELQHMLDHLSSTSKCASSVRRGGAGGKALRVLGGHADAYLHPNRGLKKWDTCAVEAVLKASGASVTDKYGKQLVYDPEASYQNEDGVCITRNLIHAEYLFPASKQ